jgi:hypothetical protein
VTQTLAQNLITKIKRLKGGGGEEDIYINIDKFEYIFESEINTKTPNIKIL